MEVAPITFPVWPRPRNWFWWNECLPFTGVLAPSVLLAEDKNIHSFACWKLQWEVAPTPTPGLNQLLALLQQSCSALQLKENKENMFIYHPASLARWTRSDLVLWGMLSSCLYNHVQPRGKRVLCLGWNNFFLLAARRWGWACIQHALADLKKY